MRVLPGGRTQTLELGDVAVQLDRLAAAFGRKPADDRTVPIWYGVLRDQKIQAHELAGGVTIAMTQAVRYPSLAELLQRITQYRVNRAAEFERDDAEAKQRQWEIIEAEDSQNPAFGPLCDEHGQPDPDWPEIDGARPAWLRRMAWLGGLCTKQAAQDPLNHQGGGFEAFFLGSPQPQRGGPRRIH